MNTIDKMAFGSVFTSEVTDLQFNITTEYMDTYSGEIDYGAKRALFDEDEVTNETVTQTEWFYANNTQYESIECGEWQATPIPPDLFNQLFGPGGGLRLFSLEFVDAESFEFEGTIDNTVTVISNDIPENYLESIFANTGGSFAPNYFRVMMDINVNTYFIEQLEIRLGGRFQQGTTVQEINQTSVIRAIPLPATFVIPVPSGIPVQQISAQVELEELKSCNCVACVACAACTACAFCALCAIPLAVIPATAIATGSALTLSATSAATSSLIVAQGA